MFVCFRSRPKHKQTNGFSQCIKMASFAFFLQTNLRALEAPVSMFSPSSLTNQSIRTKCLCDSRRQSISNRAETEKKKKGERKRVMEEGRETDWTGEMGRKEEGLLSEKSVYVCVVTFDLCRVTFMVGAVALRTLPQLQWR